MSYTVPETEPTEIIAGDLVTWTKALSDYPASSWTLKYSLRAEGSGTAIDITATASGDDHLVSVAKTTTDDWAAGTYKWQAYVESGSERYTVGSGTVVITPTLSLQTSAYDSRSHAKKVLDALESVILGKASADALSYSIGGRSITKMTPQELITWRSFYRSEYARELSAEKIRQGKSAGTKVRVRWV